MLAGCWRAAIRRDDAMIMGSPGPEMKTIVNAPAGRFPGKTANQAAV
jgi:hypothetical protein